MVLIAQMLQRAGLKFLSARGRHTKGGVIIEEVTCESDADAASGGPDPFA
jgi:hypothetical protein